MVGTIWPATERPGTFNLDWAEMDERNRLVFQTHEEGKLTFEEYLGCVVFYEKRTFTRDQFRDFMFEAFPQDARTHHSTRAPA
jgi:hypothetical protein